MAAAHPALDGIDRNSLSDDRGVSFKEFRRGLTPRYLRVWGDIIAGHAALLATCLALVEVQRSYPALLPLAVILGALTLGYVIAYIQLFFHEAAHYNIAKGRALNDFLANLFIGILVGQNVKAYRVVHFDHHRFLGTPEDTERSYFDALSGRFIFEALTGIKIVKTLLRRSKHVNAKAPAGSPKPGGTGMLVLGLLLNLSIVGASVLTGSWAMALAWPLGMVVVHPFVNAVRQVLEHRDFDARSDVDYAVQPHGTVTRMFGSGPIASTLGGAGFNRHLLHHWDPQLSYTRFAELQAYLLRTPAADALLENTVTYGQAFVRLLAAP